MMNLLGDLGTEHSKQATEAVVPGNDFGVKVGEAPINEVAAQFPFQPAKTPAFQMLEYTATQEAIGSHAGASGTGRLWVAVTRHWRTSAINSSSSKSWSTGWSKSSLSKQACWAKGRKKSQDWWLIEGTIYDIILMY